MKQHNEKIKLQPLLSKKQLALGLAAVVFAVALSGCIENQPGEPSGHFYSFNEDMQGWQKDGTDLNNPPIEWTVEQTTNISYNGSGSVKLYLDNMNDAGKIWMEKNYSVQPNTMYEINISYFFATSDYGDFNLFTIICGVTSSDPETIDDLTFQGDTGHHQDEQQNYLWLEKNYTFQVQSDEHGTLWVSIGVWGTWETPRTYFVDEVNISMKPLSSDHLPDLSGSWQIAYYDWEGNITRTENVTMTQTDFTVTLSNGTKTLGQGIIRKNTLLPPFNTTEYLITDLDFGGLGIDTIYVYNESYMKTELPLCENCNPAIITRS